MCNHYLRIAPIAQQPSAKARNRRPSKPGIDSGLQHLNTVKEHIAPHQQSAAHGHLSVPQTFPWPAAARSPRYHSWNCLKPSIGPLHLLRHHSPRGPSSTAPWICLKHIPSSFPSHGLTVGKTEDFCHHYQHIPLDAKKNTIFDGEIPLKYVYIYIYIKITTSKVQHVHWRQPLIRPECTGGTCDVFPVAALPDPRELSSTAPKGTRWSASTDTAHR